MIWILHLIILTLFLILSLRLKNNKFFIGSSFLYVILVFGQRWMTGTDVPNYLRYYLTDFRVPEPIYRTIQVFLAENNLYFGILLFLVLLITVFNNYRFILKFDRYVLFILYFYLLSEVFFAQLSQTRQFAAISFFINAYFYAFEKKKFKSLLNILLGAGFHTSILFLVPFIFIRLKINRIKALYMLLVSAVLPLLDITLLLRLPFFSRYAHYVESRFNVSLSMFHYLKFYALVFLVFIYLWNLRKYRKDTKKQLILNGMLLNVFIYAMSFQFAPMIRVSFYFKIFEVLFLVYFLDDVKKYSKEILKFGVASFLLLIYSGVVLTDPYLTNNYQFRHLRLRDERSNKELYREVERFKEKYH